MASACGPIREMSCEKVSTALLVYAILVVASCVFWVWHAARKPRPSTGANNGNFQAAADGDNRNIKTEDVTKRTTPVTHRDRTDNPNITDRK
jgi:hypothetical protein